jgi:hypothetical protein
MEWGFIPSWPSIRSRADVEQFRKGYTDANGKYHMPYTTLNAVGEELLDKEMLEITVKVYHRFSSKVYHSNDLL